MKTLKERLREAEEIIEDLLDDVNYANGTKDFDGVTLDYSKDIKTARSFLEETEWLTMQEGVEK